MGWNTYKKEKGMNSEEVYRFASNNFPELELWSGYYKRRYIEFVDYLKLLKGQKFETALELGCGIGYGACFLSGMAKRVIASDIEDTNQLTHSPGLEPTRKFLSNFPELPIEILAASAEQIPLANQTVDFIFSSHVLEHVPNKKASIAEVERLLKPNGIYFCVVPTRTERFYSIIAYYISLVKRIPGKLFNRQKDKGLSVHSKESVTVNQFTKRNILLPPIHGTGPTYFNEWKTWSYGNWLKFFKESEKLEIVYSGTTQIGSNLIILGELFPSIAIHIYKLTHGIQRILGGYFPFNRFGINAVFILKRK